MKVHEFTEKLQFTIFTACREKLGEGELNFDSFSKLSATAIFTVTIHVLNDILKRLIASSNYKSNFLNNFLKEIKVSFYYCSSLPQYISKRSLSKKENNDNSYSSLIKTSASFSRSERRDQKQPKFSPHKSHSLDNIDYKENFKERNSTHKLNKLDLFANEEDSFSELSEDNKLCQIQETLELEVVNTGNRISKESINEIIKSYTDSIEILVNSEDNEEWLTRFDNQEIIEYVNNMARELRIHMLEILNMLYEDESRLLLVCELLSEESRFTKSKIGVINNRNENLRIRVKRLTRSNRKNSLTDSIDEDLRFEEIKSIANIKHRAKEFDQNFSGYLCYFEDSTNRQVLYFLREVLKVLLQPLSPSQLFILMGEKYLLLFQYICNKYGCLYSPQFYSSSSRQDRTALDSINEYENSFPSKNREDYYDKYFNKVTIESLKDDMLYRFLERKKINVKMFTKLTGNLYEYKGMQVEIKTIKNTWVIKRNSNFVNLSSFIDIYK